MILKGKSTSKEEDDPEPEPDDKETRSIADISKDSDDDEDAEGKHGTLWLNLTTIWGQILHNGRNDSYKRQSQLWDQMICQIKTN